MNYYKQIAEMLGVEFGEEFKIKFDDGSTCTSKYKLTEKGCADLEHGSISDAVLGGILREKIEIVKLPWKPQKGERYWWYSPSWKEAVYTIWYGNLCDLVTWKVGNCFKTEEEAKTRGKELMETIRKEYEES